MSSTRDKMNVMALLGQLGLRKPARELDQPLVVAAPGAGGGMEKPDGLDLTSPDETLHVKAEATNAGAFITWWDESGNQIKIGIDAAGNTFMRVIDETGAGVKVTPDGIVGVQVDDVGTESESETETTSPYGELTVTGCVNGVDQTIVVLGYIPS